MSGFAPPRMQDCSVWKKDQVFEAGLVADYPSAEGIGINHGVSLECQIVFSLKISSYS